MPMPKPLNTEKEDDFISRFMADDLMKKEFPKEEQRLAIAKTQWDKREFIDDLEAVELEIDIQPKNKQWILVFPKGKHFINKYQTELVFDDAFFNEIKAAFDDDKLSKPFIDKDHEYKESFGDIEKYRITNKGMEFYVSLNSKGVEMIKDNVYRYISPAFGRVVSTDGKEYSKKLISISLVNMPALQGAIPSLQTQFAFSDSINVIKIKEVKKMTEILKTLQLNENASETAAINEIVKLKAENETSKKSVAELSDKLKSSENARLELSAEIQKINSEKLASEAKSVITQAVKSGKIHPSVADIYENRYLTGKEDVIKELSLIPENWSVQLTANNPDNSELNDKQSALMIEAGLNPKDAEDVKIFKATFKEGGK